MHLAVSAIGADRPGIVAAVTGVLVEHGCNLEDTSMSILRGHFAMTLVVATPPEADAQALEAAIGAATGDLGLLISVRPIDDAVAASPAGEPWTVSVYGADRPGIVHRVTSLLAGEGINIVDLTTRVIGDDARPVYAMFLDVTVPEGATLSDHLDALAAELGISCTAHPVDADIL
jgi:glycine cleavage system transcriptional repressor